MPFISTKDTEFGDCYFDISKTDKRLIRATLKTYERTGTYVFLKLFKKATDDYEFEHRISLTLGEIESLSVQLAKYRTQWLISSHRQNHHQRRNQKFKKKLSTTMVEAMFERSPNYFKTISETVQISHCGRETYLFYWKLLCSLCSF